jgi:hypothetical protein
VSRRRRQAIDEDVPRIPRGRGMTLTKVQLMKIAFTAVLLVLVIVLQRPCAEATGRFVQSFEPSDAAPGAKQPIQKPEQIEVPGSSGVYVDLKGLSQEEQIKAMEQARQEAAAAAGVDRAAAGNGSAASGSAAAGSAAP